MNTIKNRVWDTLEFREKWANLIGQLEHVNWMAQEQSDKPTEMAEAVSLARYRLEQVAALLGCAQEKPPSPEKVESGACGYCGGNHLPEVCPNVFRPIVDCEHADTVDGCCNHPKNLTPECHVGACPRLDKRIRDNWEATT